MHGIDHKTGDFLNMAGNENRTITIKFRVTPTEHQLLKRAYALQKRGWFRTHSKYYRAVLLREANSEIAEHAAESRQSRQARALARIHGGKKAAK